MVRHAPYDRGIMLLYNIRARRILAACLMREVRLELVREDNGFTNETVTYSYDPWGNMLEKVTYAHTTEETPSGPVKTMTYTYGNPDWQDELTGISTVTGADTVNEQIVYDANGNAVSYRGATLTWNGKQLASYTKDGTAVSYAYDENGLRLRKTVNGTQTDYYYNGSLLMSMVSGDDTLLFSYDQGGNVVSVNHNGTEYYYLRNGQGDIIKIIDGSGTAVVTYGYDSWGRLISCDGSLATTLGTLNPFRYRGYVYDEETGLYYLQSRYYDPELCRFISSDVLLSTGQGVLGHNAFAYCGNVPITRMDNDGHSAHVVELIGGGSSQNGSETSAGEIRDVTNEIDVALADVVYQAKMDKDIYKSDWIQYPVQRLNIYSKFRNMVNHDAPWDIKREQRWKDTIQTDFPGFDTKVKYREHEVTPENIGNITYGYIGAAYDIPLPVLICGSYYAAGLPIESAALKNETGDWNYISMGYDYYFADLLK